MSTYPFTPPNLTPGLICSSVADAIVSPFSLTPISRTHIDVFQPLLPPHCIISASNSSRHSLGPTHHPRQKNSWLTAHLQLFFLSSKSSTQVYPQFCSKPLAMASFPASISSRLHRSSPSTFLPHSSYYPRAQVQQIFLENLQATPTRKTGSLSVDLHLSLLSS